MSLENNTDILLSADEVLRRRCDSTLNFSKPLSALRERKTHISKSQLQIAKQIKSSILLEQDCPKKRWYDISEKLDTKKMYLS